MQLKISSKATAIKISLKELQQLLDHQPLQAQGKFGAQNVNIILSPTQEASAFAINQSHEDGSTLKANISHTHLQQLMAMGADKNGLNIDGVQLQVDMKGDVRGK